DEGPVPRPRTQGRAPVPEGRAGGPARARVRLGGGRERRLRRHRARGRPAERPSRDLRARLGAARRRLAPGRAPDDARAGGAREQPLTHRRAWAELWKFTLIRASGRPWTLGTPWTQSCWQRPPMTTRSPARGDNAIEAP